VLEIIRRGWSCERGYKDTATPLLIAGIDYWAIGFAGGCLLAFPLGQGATGLWWGLAPGLATVATLLVIRFVRIGRRKHLERDAHFARR
jgi:MATE family multidrug resistance protein